MPTFTDSVADAGEASEALRALAHASRTFDHPEEMYGVLGDLLGGLRSLEQVLEQIANVHLKQRGRATNDAGSRAAGTRDALQTCAELRHTARRVGEAERLLNEAMSAASRIAWRPTTEVRETAGRFINVAFVQGEDACDSIRLIECGGVGKVALDLAGHDFGDETVDAALENGYVYDEVPIGTSDRSYEFDAYTVVYNSSHGHVALYRREDALPSPTLLGLEAPRHAAPARKDSPIESRRSRQERLGNPDLGDIEPELGQVRGLSL